MNSPETARRLVSAVASVSSGSSPGSPLPEELRPPYSGTGQPAPGQRFGPRGPGGGSAAGGAGGALPAAAPPTRQPFSAARMWQDLGSGVQRGARAAPAAAAGGEWAPGGAAAAPGPAGPPGARQPVAAAARPL